jgi:hypothetical protein
LEIDKMFVKFNEQNMASEVQGLLPPTENPADWTVCDDALMSARRIIKDGDTVRAATDAECDAELATLRTAAAANKMRWERDQMLAISDSWMLADRWAKFTAAKQAEITTFREALRNLPAQPGFPLEVTIPPAPVV